ncbi:IucA/IucC family protein [Methylobacterium sp. B4]|uniref:IucA/IucC family protein n=1 Tax=Methylobacterium sp. B4 TaxID=1938755 RepID=UPI000D76CDAB|nr:IucA/IucC family protein [Methylobacterium sp. B4]PXW65333.1 siderophore synthetase component [Methylobacterium sp. B4]
MSGPMAEAPASPNLAGDLLAELFDALWIEDVAGFRSRGVLGPPAEDGTRDYALVLGRGHLRARVRADGWRDGIRFAGSARFETACSREDLDASALLERALDGLSELSPAIRERTLDELRRIVDELPPREALIDSLVTRARADDPILWERLAAWRDRPFHPLSRSRRGLDRAQALAYGAEAGRFFALSWCAVARDRLARSLRAGQAEPDAAILDPRQRALLAREMETRGLARSHVALPLHPWQAAHVLPERFAPDIAEGGVVLLDFRGPLVAATSSLRTVAFPARPGLHLKLPLDVSTLGVRRLLPPQSLHNGLHGGDLLAAGLARDPWMTRFVALADETAFWHFAEPDGDLYAERPALLGCALRGLPVNGGPVIPLASLAVAPRGGLPPAARVVAGEAPDLARLFAGIAGLVLGTVLRSACLGFVPELHGQNALVAFDGAGPGRLILRDHDTVRCAPEWLAGAGLPVPSYLITDPRRNSLLLPRPDDLLAYAQTLAIDVALRAIAEAFAAADAGFTLDEARRILVATIRGVLASAEVPAERKALVAACLLERPTAPFKQVLTPLLDMATLTTSMPSRLGHAPNPLFLRPGP